MSGNVYGNGGPNGARIYWPAGLEAMTPAERAAALEVGFWNDRGAIVTRDGRRFEEPIDTHELVAMIEQGIRP